MCHRCHARADRQIDLDIDYERESERKIIPGFVIPLSWAGVLSTGCFTQFIAGVTQGQ